MHIDVSTEGDADHVLVTSKGGVRLFVEDSCTNGYVEVFSLPIARDAEHQAAAGMVALAPDASAFAYVDCDGANYYVAECDIVIHIPVVDY